MKLSDKITIIILSLLAAAHICSLIVGRNVLISSFLLAFSLSVIGIILWYQPIVQSILIRKEAILMLARSDTYILLHGIVDEGGIGAKLNANLPSECCAIVLSACVSELSKAEQAGDSIINELGIKKQGEDD